MSSGERPIGAAKQSETEALCQPPAPPPPPSECHSDSDGGRLGQYQRFCHGICVNNGGGGDGRGAPRAPPLRQIKFSGALGYQTQYSHTRRGAGADGTAELLWFAQRCLRLRGPVAPVWGVPWPDRGVSVGVDRGRGSSAESSNGGWHRRPPPPREPRVPRPKGSAGLPNPF